MSIKGGEILHVADQVLLDRLQTAGPGQLNIPTNKIYELGNYQAVGTILDIPDISFPLTSIDASAELEATLVGSNFATDAAGTEYDLSKCIPLDVLGQFKRGKTDASPFDVEGSVAVPYLTVESLSYKFGVDANAEQSASLKGDSIFYAPGSSYIQEVAGTNAANQAILLTHGAYPYHGDVVNGVRYALAVTTASGKRLSLGADYTEAATGSGSTKAVTVTILAAVPTTDKIRITYSSDTVANYPQVSHAAASATRPAAIKGRNIRVFVNGTDITDVWTGVQNFTADWKVTLDRDIELGNSEVVAQDYDIADVSGTIDLKARNAADLFKKIAQIAGAASTLEVIGALQQAVLPLDIVLYSPTDGSVLKTLYCPDAKFTVPGYSGQVQAKMVVTFNWASDTGVLKVYKGARP